MIKDLLREAVKSFRRTHKSVPNRSARILINTKLNFSLSEQSSYTYTAPCDGFITAQISAGANFIAISVNGGSDFIVDSTHCWGAGIVPCRAGDQIKVYANSSVNAMQDVWIAFSPVVGDNAVSGGG